LMNLQLVLIVYGQNHFHLNLDIQTYKEISKQIKY